MSVIGIFIENQRVKAAHVDRKGRVLSCHTWSIHEHVDIRQQFSLKPWKRVSLVSGLSTKAVLLRKIILPLKEGRTLKAALPFAWEEAVPAFEDHAMVCAWNFVSLREGTSVSLLATKEDRVRAHLEQWAHLGVFPDLVTAQPLALFAMCTYLYAEKKELLAFYFAEGNSFWIYVQNGELSCAHAMQGWESFAQEEQKICRFLQEKKKCNVEKLSRVFFGKPHIPEGCLLQSNRESSHRLDIESEYILAIGLAYASEMYPVQLAQKRTLPKQARVRKKREIIALCSIVFLCLALVILGGEGVLHKRREPLLASIRESTGKNVRGEDDVYAVFAEREQELLMQAEHLLLAKSPKVAWVLAWVSAHPELAMSEGASEKEIEIVQVHTRLEKGKMIVEITLKTDAPERAEKFHQALGQGDPFIDATKPILWEAQAPSYKAAFTIQNH